MTGTLLICRQPATRLSNPAERANDGCPAPAPDIHALFAPRALERERLETRPARLADIVTSMWFGEGRTAYQRDRILPSGQSQLLINLGPPQYRVQAGPPEVRVPFVDVWYSGLHQGPIDTEAPHGNALLGVAFGARGAFPWLGERMDGLSDRISGLADALGDGARRLRERLLNPPKRASIAWSDG